MALIYPHAKFQLPSFVIVDVTAVGVIIGQGWYFHPIKLGALLPPTMWGTVPWPQGAALQPANLRFLLFKLICKIVDTQECFIMLSVNIECFLKTKCEIDIFCEENKCMKYIATIVKYNFVWPTSISHNSI